MKIAVGLFYLECNTFNVNLTTRDKFVFAQGEAMLPYIHVVDQFKQAGAQLVPTIMASTLPAGRLKEEDFWFFANQILDCVRENPDLDGIWLHLHGSMEVENVGSGDLRLLQELRKIVGKEVLIAVALDAHANNDARLADYVNVMRGYHTIPHSDQPETERIVADGLLRLIREKQNVRPALITIPALLSGEKGLSAAEPLKSLINRTFEMEKNQEILAATFFMGDPWSDCPNSHLSVSVIPARKESAALAEQYARELAQTAIDRLDEFAFEVPVLEPAEALKRALKFPKRPVFITDSGDNTTGGAVGEGTEMLRLVHDTCLETKKRILITAIHDESAYQACVAAGTGNAVTVQVGTGRDETSVPIEITGTVKCPGKVLGYLNCDSDECGACVTVSMRNIDVVLSDAATSFITPAHFSAAGTPLEEYDIVVLKQGYLFAQLRPLTELAIMAVTKGATYQYIEELAYKKIIHPIYPFERDVKLS